jgi:hypothetical protein
MKTVRQLIRERIEPATGKPRPPLNELRKTEWCDEFERLMRNRLVMGAFRYQLFREHHQGESEPNFAADAKKRIRMYEATGNTELLVDAANMLMMEFRFGWHQNKHFHPVDDGDHYD